MVSLKIREQPSIKVQEEGRERDQEKVGPRSPRIKTKKNKRGFLKLGEIRQ